MKKFFTEIRLISLAVRNIVESKYKSINTLSYSNNYWNKNFFHNNCRQIFLMIYQRMNEIL